RDLTVTGVQTCALPISGAGDLVGHADAAYANARKYRSTTGFCYTIGGAPISWTSKWQSITTQSTTESEYIALNEAGKQIIWLHRSEERRVGKECRAGGW